MVTLLALGLPVAGDFFPQQYHMLFTNMKTLIHWLSPEVFASNVLPDSCLVMVLGSHSFIGDILHHMKSVRQQEDSEKDKQRSRSKRRYQP